MANAKAHGNYPAITHIMPMEDVNDAIAALRSGNAGKVVLVMGVP